MGSKNAPGLIGVSGLAEKHFDSFRKRRSWRGDPKRRRGSPNNKISGGARRPGRIPGAFKEVSWKSLNVRRSGLLA